MKRTTGNAPKPMNRTNITIPVSKLPSSATIMNQRGYRTVIVISYASMMDFPVEFLNENNVKYRIY